MCGPCYRCFHNICSSVQFSSVTQSCLTLCNPMNCSMPISLSITNSPSLVKPTSIESVMPSSHFILCRPLLFLPPIPPSIKVFSKESTKEVQFSSVAQSCPTVCNPMNRSTPGLPVHHQLPEFTQTHVHRVRDAIQPSHPLSSPSSPAPNPSQHQGLFQ